jgi:CRISPR system Cascade subunit CasE
MAHLTQVNLDFATVAKLQFRDTYDWHQAVWKAFSGKDGRERDFLTRLDRQPDGYRLLIVSPIEPMRPDWCPPNSECWKSKPIPETYFTRRRYAFQLCANPTKKVAVQKREGSFTKNGRRVPLHSREDLVAWVNRKGDQGGFSVDEDTLRTFSRGREDFEKDGVRGVHSAVEFQGVLTVNDPQKFHATFTQGVGSAKAFGFGLLVIAPIA